MSHAPSSTAVTSYPRPHLPSESLGPVWPGALVRGYDATLVADAHTTDDPSQWGLPLNAEQVIAHTNMYWSYEAAPGRSGGTVPTADVDFGTTG